MVGPQGVPKSVQKQQKVSFVGSESSLEMVECARNHAFSAKLANDGLYFGHTVCTHG